LKQEEGKTKIGMHVPRCGVPMCYLLRLAASMCADHSNRALTIA